MTDTAEQLQENELKENHKSPKLTLVHVNMSENTLQKINEVKKRVHADNKTTAIRYSIDIAAMITDVISKGGKVILEEGGNTYIMKLPGVG